MRVTVKHVKDGRVSRWINHGLKPGDMLDVMTPAGRFCLRGDEGGLVLLGTPLYSLAKTPGEVEQGYVLTDSYGPARRNPL